MLACMNIRRTTQLQWTLLETKQSEIRFITNENCRKQLGEFRKTEVNSYVDIDNKVDIIYTVYVIESRKSLKRKPQSEVQTLSSLCETSFDESH